MRFRKVKSLAKNTANKQQSRHSNPSWIGSTGHALGGVGGCGGEVGRETVTILNMNQCHGKITLMRCSQWAFKREKLLLLIYRWNSYLQSYPLKFSSVKRSLLDVISDLSDLWDIIYESIRKMVCPWSTEGHRVKFTFEELGLAKKKRRKECPDQETSMSSQSRDFPSHKPYPESSKGWSNLPQLVPSQEVLFTHMVGKKTSLT